MREVKKSFWDAVAVGGSIVLAIPLMIVSESIQARYLGAANYGKVALIYSSISLVFLFSLNWLTHSLLRFGKEEYVTVGHLRKTSTTYLLAALALFIPSLVILYMIQKPLFEFLEIKHAQAFWIIAIGIAIQVAKTYVLETLKTIRLIKVQTFLLRLGLKLFIVTGVLLLTFDWVPLNVNSIIVVILLSDLLVAIVGFGFIKKRYIFPFIFDKQQLKSILLFCFPFFFSGWVSYLLGYVDVYTIKYYMQLDDVGVYQAAFKMYSTLKSFIDLGITSIMVPILIVMKTEGKQEKINNYLKRIVPQVIFVAFIVISLVITFSDIVFELIYGDTFAASIIPFKILTAPIVLGTFSSLILGILMAYDMTKLLALIGIFVAVVNLLGDIILVKHFGINGAAYATAFTRTIFPLVWFVLVYKKFKIKRNISLLFCSLIFVVLIVNLLPIAYGISIGLTILLMVGTTIFARQFNLFNKNDIAFLNGINMPKRVKDGFEKIVFLLSK